MEKRPDLDIFFPAQRENELLDEMVRLAAPPWSPQAHDAFGRPPEEGALYFHRDAFGDDVPCTLHVAREKAGHWVVTNLTPDDGYPGISVEAYKRILADFDGTMADAAATLTGGMSRMATSKYLLEDYFSKRARELLSYFIDTRIGFGGHDSDKAKWINFLIQAYDEDAKASGDELGYCLKSADLWPEEDVKTLVEQYDFAMCVLKQAGRPRKISDSK